VYEHWWDALRWLRCHVLRQHYPQSAYESKPWEPLLDRRNGYYWRKTGRLECAVCRRDLGPNPDGVGAWY
jgi:hypothetical protein